MDEGSHNELDEPQETTTRKKLLVPQEMAMMH